MDIDCIGRYKSSNNTMSFIVTLLIILKSYDFFNHVTIEYEREQMLAIKCILPTKNVV